MPTPHSCGSKVTEFVGVVDIRCLHANGGRQKAAAKGCEKVHCLWAACAKLGL